ncbi:MAG: CheR family methyltransferase [Promethearchaeota archaeon]
MNPKTNVVTLEYEEGIIKLLNFLQSFGIAFSPKSETRVIKRLKIMVEMYGLKDYSELLNLLQEDPQTRNNLFKWLKRGKVFNEEENSFTPLVQLHHEKVPRSNSKEIRKHTCDWGNHHLKIESDNDWNDSERSSRKILDFLSNKKVKYTSTDESRILNRLKLIAQRIGFKDYSSLLKLLNSDPHTLEAVINWLEKGRVYNEEENSYSPLVKRKKTLDDPPRCLTARKLKRRPTKTFDLSLIPSIPDPTDVKYLSLVYNFFSRNNVNYEAYKEKYFLRRIHSRMMKVDAQTYREYLGILESDPEEIELLIDNLSINVTRFFRDKDLWAALKDRIFPKITGRSKTTRIWSAGCAVGPEPYSIAILMFDRLKNINLDRLHILATDLSQEFLDQAQAGVFSHELLEDINAESFQTYFKPITPELFQLSKHIRDKVIFKKHDLRDPPPSQNFDLILCRNVLIYFSRSQAEKLFHRFHSALKPEGYLVLGKCELVPIPTRHLFKVVDSRTRIYQREGLVE